MAKASPDVWDIPTDLRKDVREALLQLQRPVVPSEQPFLVPPWFVQWCHSTYGSDCNVEQVVRDEFALLPTHPVVFV